MDELKLILIIILVTFLIWFTIYLIWNGWNISFKSDEISIYFEQYPAKRFFIKTNEVYKPNETVHSTEDDAF